MACISLLSFSLLGLFIFSFVEAQPNDTLTFELINRDFPESPFYQISETDSMRLTNALYRSVKRFSRLHQTLASNSSSRPQYKILLSDGEYFMNISIGTPAVPFLGTVDTASDLIWTQCSPCQPCFNQTTPFFNPKMSSTYSPMSCHSRQCPQDIASCPQKGLDCSYELPYGDSSNTSGTVASDVLTLRSTSGKSVAFNKTVFGCGFKNYGSFGVIGLGAGKESLISQIDSLAKGKFSYCLVPTLSKTNSSKITFGDVVAISDSVVASTPLVGESTDTMYFLNLTGMSVGDKKIEYTDLAPNGNIVLDSGTTLTLLPEKFYAEVEKAVASKINLTKTEDPKKVFRLCYRTKHEIAAPNITAHFPGADVVLTSLNIFVRVSDYLVCLAFSPIPNDSSFGVFGNLAQINHLVIYDLKKKTVSFKQTDCSKN